LSALAPERLSLEANGLTQAYLRWSLGEGPPLVLLHGFLDLSDSFAPMIEALAAQGWSGPIYAPDLRGHGHTQWVSPEGAYHFYDYIADLHGLLQALELRHAHQAPWDLFGHSMGGVVSALYAGTFPERVRRLILAEGLGPPDRALSEGPSQARRWIEQTEALRTKAPRPYPDLEAAAARLRAGNPRLPEPLSRALAAAGTRAVDGGLIWRFDPRHRTPSALPFQTARLRPFLEAIEAPTLLIEGSASPMPGWWRDRDGAIPGASTHVIEAGHMLHHDAPAALAQATHAFFREIP